MTMHLVAPYLTTTGKKRGKQKFRNAEAAKLARELEADWQKLMKSHGENKKVQEKIEPLIYKLTSPRETPNVGQSIPDSHKGAVASKQTPKYTGTKMLGIGTLHKSNAVPIFTDDEAKSISSMRR